MLDWLMPGSDLEKMDKATRKNLKKIQRQIKRFKHELKKIELRPCSSDAELRQKEEDINTIKREIYDLEKEANQFALYISSKG
jgi:septal ring factor EnvC (AmiA/AmiB activator)